MLALGSCSVFHPYRMPTPKASPEFKAQQKAAARARKKQESVPLFKKKPNPADEEAATDVSTPTRGPMASVATTPEARTLPERATVHYDKQGLMKNKPKLMRRRRNKPAPKPFRPWKSIRHFFKYDLRAKPNYSPDHRPAAPVATPDAAPDAEPPTKP